MIEKEASKIKDERVKNAYLSYLQDFREIGGIVGSMIGKMVLDKIIDPKEAEYIVEIGRRSSGA
jgi:hypothetical protein